MTRSDAEVAVSKHALAVLSQRSESYETGVQTSVCWKTGSGWINVLTKLEFVRKGEEAPNGLAYVYHDIVIVKRLLSSAEVASVVEHLASNDLLATGHDVGDLSAPIRFPIGGRVRHPHSEWSSWPADIFTLEPASGQPSPSGGPLIAIDAPFYPSFGQVLWDLYAIRVQSWMNYFRGQVVLVLADFRARISKLTVALAYLRADIECGTLRPSDLVVKIYAESQTGRLAQETIRPKEPFVQLDLSDKPSLVCVALVWEATGETLHEKVFQEGVSQREPNVVVEAAEPEIEQLLLTGESETIEFKEKLDKGRPEKLAKTAVAFANTKGGRIVFGVDNEHHVVGCAVAGMADTITNILRSHCDPPPASAIRVIKHEDRDLLVVEVSESASAVHTVKDLGPFIRANGSNRSPTAHELALLFRKHETLRAFQ